MTVDVSGLASSEVVMRVKTDVGEHEARPPVFYTDSNGIQLLKRTYRSFYPVEASYYPMPSAAVLQNRDRRLTVVGDCPHGVTSPTNGMLEIMLDRIAQYDDNKGLGSDREGLSRDNVPVTSRFMVMMEELSLDSVTPPHYLFHTALGHHASQALLFPPILLTSMAANQQTDDNKPTNQRSSKDNTPINQRPSDRKPTNQRNPFLNKLTNQQSSDYKLTNQRSSDYKPTDQRTRYRRSDQSQGASDIATAADDGDSHVVTLLPAGPLACDLELVSLRPMQQRNEVERLVIARRAGLDCGVGTRAPVGCTNEKVSSLKDLLAQLKVRQIQQVSLSAAASSDHPVTPVSALQSETLKQNEIRPYLIKI